MFSLPSVEALPSVAAALRWLLAIDSAAETVDVLQEARRRGVISASAGPNWKTNGPAATKLLKVALRRGAVLDSRAAGAVLHGIGELAARCHDRFDLPVRALLKKSGCDVDFGVVMDVAAAFDDKSRRPPSLEELAAAQWISGARLEWTDFQDASWRLQHPWIGGSGVFGFAFVARVGLRADLPAVDRWIQAHPNNIALATIGRAAVDLGIRTGALKPTLRSSTVALKLLAAAACVSPVFPPPRPPKVRDVLTVLAANGFDPGDAIWMAGSLAKGALHRRYGLEDRRQQNSARLAYLEKHPEAAVGGVPNVEAERQSLERHLAEAEARYSELLPAFEAMLAELAEGWPATGLTTEQMAQLENIFVETPEIRFRLASKLHHRANRDWLLEKNLDQVKRFLGLANPRETLGIPLELAEKFAIRTAPWAAQSAVLLFHERRRGIGRCTSDLLHKFTEEAENKLSQPFFAARAGLFWQYAATRAANAYLFALMVVAATPEDRRGEVEKLNELVTEHAEKLLSLQVPSHPDPRAFDRLAASAVAHMGLFASGGELRRHWASNPELGTFPRALATWSCPDIVHEDPKRANDLFKSIGVTPLSRGDRDRHLSNLLTLLDCAVAACAKAGRKDLLDQIKDLWSIAYQGWRSVSAQWTDAASDFIAAVEVDGAERTKFCTDPAFANTFCRRLIEVCSQEC